MQITTTIDIDRPVAEVFDYITDTTRFPEWNTEVVSTTYTGPLRLGATGVNKMKVGNKLVDSPWAVTHFESPERAVVEFSKPVAAVVEFTFRETANGATRMACHSVLRPKGVWRLLGPMIKAEAAKTDRTQFQKAKEILEGRRS